MHILCIEAIALWEHRNIREFLSHTEIPDVRRMRQRGGSLNAFPQPVVGVLDGISTLEKFEGAFRLRNEHIKAGRKGAIPPHSIAAIPPLPIIPATKEELIKEIRRSLEATVPSVPTEGCHRPPLCLQKLLQSRPVRLRFLDALISSELS